jgi:hypothetical protein
MLMLLTCIYSIYRSDGSFGIDEMRHVLLSTQVNKILQSMSGRAETALRRAIETDTNPYKIPDSLAGTAFRRAIEQVSDARNHFKPQGSRKTHH